MKDEMDEDALSFDEMNNISGGHMFDTAADAIELYDRGLISSPDADFSEIRTAFNKLGFKYVDHTDLIHKNEYFNKNNNKVSRDEFWENFDTWRT